MNESPSESTSDVTQATTKAGLSRRVVVQGAAWSIPVIAAAVATPLAAASGDGALSFTLRAYAGTACTEITNVQATLTNSSGAPDAGKPVTVTLSDGYTFADGSTTYTGTTNASGKVTLPAVRVPATGGATTFLASSAALTASAPGTAPKVGEAHIYDRSTGQTYTFPTVPAGSTAIGDTTFLASDGDLYVGNVLIASGVSSVGAPSLDNSNNSWTPYMSSSGVASIYSRDAGQTYTFLSVPADSKPLGDTAFLAPNGDLYVGNVLVSTGVTSAGVPSLDSGNNSWTPYVSSAGVAGVYSRDDGQTFTFPAVPVGSTAIGDATFLAPNGDLYVGNSLAASGVTSVGVPSLDTSNNSWTPYISSTGIASIYSRTNGQSYTFPSIPLGSTPISDTTFLAPNGDVYVGNTLIASNVTSVGLPSLASGNDTFTPYVVAPACAW